MYELLQLQRYDVHNGASLDDQVCFHCRLQIVACRCHGYTICLSIPMDLQARKCGRAQLAKQAERAKLA